MAEEKQTRLDVLFAGEPAFDNRAFMLDVSRDRVPTRATLGWLINVLAQLRFTELQLYVEHTFTYTGHEIVWRDASPLTHDDMAWIAHRASLAGLELVANMNGFGHMGRWLVHDGYRYRAECPDGAPALFGDGTMEPGCLEPTADNAAFAVALAREMRDAVGGDRIHIGGDEPFELGDGRSAGRVAEQGRTRVYLDHLRRIIDPLIADGAEVMFWADQFRREPELMKQIPSGATGVVWTYEAPGDSAMSDLLPTSLIDRLGMPEDMHLGFESHGRLFIESGTPFWVAPGTSSWNTILGRNSNAAANVVDAAVVGSLHGADGYLLTDWGDNGHWQPLVVSLPSIVRAAVAAWSAGRSHVDVGPVIDQLLDAKPGTGALIDQLGHLGESLGMTTINGSPIFAALNAGTVAFGDADPTAVDAALDKVAEATAAFAAQPFGGARGTALAAEMLAAARLGRLGLRRIAGDAPSAVDIDAALAEQREAWLLSSRPGGLDDSIAKFVT
ncbi:MAG: glycoside hydrolase, partial [Acidobacteria bacterium]|nr:glycoside hydrolase [Acidobacteriota bacterium]